MSSELEEPLGNGHFNGNSPVADQNGDLGLNDDLLDDDEDLFGDDNGDQEKTDTPTQRRLDDEELDSGDDDGRRDRVAATIEDEDDGADERPAKLMSADIARVNYPEGDELYLLNMPPYLGIKHRNFDYATYEPPEFPHDGVDPALDPTHKFSPYSTATTSIFWRRDPKNADLLQSNARFIRWSDGSLTLQLASRPQDHYRVSSTSVRQQPPKSKQPASSQSHHSHDPSKDSHMYLAASHATPGLDLQIIRPFDHALKILPTGDQTDESVSRLRQNLKAMTSGIHDPVLRLKVIEEDPEMAKKAAEAFEKEKARAMRKREAAEDRHMNKRDRVLGRSGYGGGGASRSAGLSIAGLEDDDGMPLTKSKQKRRKMNRRGDILSDGEDSDGPQHRTRDEYDRDDGFLASSDEEPEIYEDDEGEEPVLGADSDDDPDRDDLEIEGRETVIHERTRGGNIKPDRESKKKSKKIQQKRTRMDEIEDDDNAGGNDDDDDDDAEGEVDTEYFRQQAAGSGGDAAAGAGAGFAAGGGGRKRRVIDDDEDEDE